MFALILAASSSHNRLRLQHSYVGSSSVSAFLWDTSLFAVYGNGRVFTIAGFRKNPYGSQGSSSRMYIRI